MGSHISSSSSPGLLVANALGFQGATIGNSSKPSQTATIGTKKNICASVVVTQLVVLVNLMSSMDLRTG
ncbi:hypothetical protein [Cuspidothrix issatschenkoi]|uniref:hypothetical protein n=1 Tax=Cuspidothrix issatschenkoi TaxID=230752 RepID=UPI0013FD55BE